MRMWRNWQTRWFQVPVKRFMWVQVPSSAPSGRDFLGHFFCAGDEDAEPTSEANLSPKLLRSPCRGGTFAARQTSRARHCSLYASAVQLPVELIVIAIYSPHQKKAHICPPDNVCFFQRNKSLAGFVKCTSCVKYAAAREGIYFISHRT